MWSYVSYAAVAALAIGVPAFVLWAWIRGLLRCRARAIQLDLLLAEQLHRVDHHSRRLESLWKLASQPPLRDEAFLQAVLTESSAAIHTGPQFYGAIAHLEGTEVVIDLNQLGGAIDGALVGGSRLPLAQTLLSELTRARMTCSWADVRADERLAGIPRVGTMPWRAFIGTPFRVGMKTYFLTFTSESALVEPFTPDDHAYLEIVASFCASRLEQREQFDRMCYEASHDALTGLSNRTAFRVTGMQALAAGEDVALAVVDIDGFRAVNERFGHQTADAVLVEVGAAIGARIRDGDVVARIGGDSFGVLLRNVSRQHDAERCIERIRTAFATPFGTGDRDGKQRIAVAASIGVAVASGGARSFERLLAQADAAMEAAKESAPACLAV